MMKTIEKSPFYKEGSALESLHIELEKAISEPAPPVLFGFEWDGNFEKVEHGGRILYEYYMGYIPLSSDYVGSNYPLPY